VTADSVKLVAEANLPTRFGDFRIVSFECNPGACEHVAVVHGDVAGKYEVPVRIHSECLTGDALGSLKCDCRDQLMSALAYLGAHPVGVLLYLRQEGRGIGLSNKVRAYELQDRGLDTSEANLHLGFPDDLRDYSVAAEMLKQLKVGSVELLTNNPKKVRGLEEAGVNIAKLTSLVIEPNPHSEKYLKTKKEKYGHTL